VLDLLASLGWDAARDAEFAPFAGSAVAGRVARVDRCAVDVITADNPLRVATANTQPLAVGDWVALAVDGRHWYVEALLERHSAIRRASARGDSAPHLLAANVDVVLVAVPAVPDPRPALAERLVALAWDSGATPLVVVTKADLVPDPAGLVDELAAIAPGADVVAVTATTPEGLGALLPHLSPGVTCCLIGRSGAGKSTLANALLGEDRFATTEIRADGKGRHTTSFRELVALPRGGTLIDTPGLRGVGLWLEGDGLDRAFADVADLVDECRFSDCEHRTEPGCAVLAAVEDGTLDEGRLERWRKLQREAAWMARRSDARLRSEEARRWKAVTLEMRRSGRARP
jgi:ribosome biogenesis GTPase